jgi:hypothetical protein
VRRVVLVVAIVGALGYVGYRWLVEPGTPRACDEIAERCQLGYDQLSACKRVFQEVRASAGDEAAGRLADCLRDESACAEAAACANRLGLDVDGQSRSLRDFTEGLRH